MSRFPKVLGRRHRLALMHRAFGGMVRRLAISDSRLSGTSFILAVWLVLVLARVFLPLVAP